MLYQKELSFIQKVFKKCNVPTFLISKSSNSKKVDIKNDSYGVTIYLKMVMDELSPKKIYKSTDSFERCYYFFLLQTNKEPMLFGFGPYLYKNLTNENVLEIGERNGVPVKLHNELLEYFASLQVLQDNSPLFTMVNAFFEAVWETPSIEIEDFNETAIHNAQFFPNSFLNIEPDDALLRKKNIERRYATENEMIRAVKLGQTHFANRLANDFSFDFFEKRNTDPVQNAKNYGIIMNTLLRKGAEEGGVHPFYLDQISSSFAHRLERISSTSDASSLMKEMFISYCKLVQKHSLQQYTQIVQKTILIIDADLSGNLSPNYLAQTLNVTLGYLSAVFKKETGKTISQYVRERRIEYAQYLLKTSNLQIQTIALHCGIIDLQYFSKQFKNYCGKSPLEYRRLITNES